MDKLALLKSQCDSGRARREPCRAMQLLGAVVFLAAMALLLMPAGASAASPALEFVVPGKNLPVSFTSEGGPVTAQMAGFETIVHCAASSAKGEIIGPRSTVSEYAFTGCVTQNGPDGGAKCQSAGANPEEIRTEPIDAELVYLSQAKHEVGILLNPGGGTYMSFECGGEPTEARGPFLSSIAPINKEATSFTAALSQLAGAQTPDEYENANGEKLKAIPEGKRGTDEWVTTGVETTITVHPSAPVEIKAIGAEEVEAKQREEQASQHEQRQREEEAATKKQREEEAAAASKRQEEEAASKKRLEEETIVALRAAIRRLLTARGKVMKIGALLRHGGLTLTFSAPESGTLIVQWWRLLPGAHLAKKAKRKPELVAQGRAQFPTAGTGTVKILLTRAGRRLLAHAKKLKLTTRARFTSTAHPTVSVTGALSLRR